MNNYITIESGYFEPFSGNETDSDIKKWSNIYFETIEETYNFLSELDEQYMSLCLLSNEINNLKIEVDRIVDAKRQQFEQQEQQQQYQKEIDRIESKYKEPLTKLYEEGWGSAYIYDYEDALKRQNGDDTRLDELYKKTSFAYEQVTEELLSTTLFDKFKSIMSHKDIDFLEEENYYSYKHETMKSFSKYELLSKHSMSTSRIEEKLLNQAKLPKEIKEKLHECLLHRVWKANKSMLIKESNIITVEKLINGKREECLIIDTGLDKTEVHDLKDNSCSLFIDSIISMGISSFSENLLGLREEETDFYYENEENDHKDVFGVIEHELTSIFSTCCIKETYKNFKSNNIEKIKSDKIKCSSFNKYNNLCVRNYNLN